MYFFMYNISHSFQAPSIPYGHVGHSNFLNAPNINSVSPPITLILQSFSLITFDAFSNLDTSSLALFTLHPTIALRFAETGVTGELLYTDPPDESPFERRLKLRAFDE